jgi:SNF2 family DNA or RNA helicase
MALSGTPHGRDPIDLWGQMKIVDGGETLGQTLGLYREVFFGKQNGFFSDEWVFHKSKTKLLNRILNNRSIRFSADQAELPALVPIVKRVSLPEDAYTYYRRALQTLRQNPGNFREQKNAWLRMRQISSGFVGYHDDDEGKTAQFEFGENPKLDLLLTLLDGIDDKAIVFYEYTYSGLRISRELKKLGIPALHMYSGCKDQGGLRRRFADDPEARVLVMQSSFGEGLNLQVARYGFFYECPVSPITRKQCCGRFVRQHSQHKSVFQYDLICRGTADDQILAFLAHGEDLFRAIIDGKSRVD